MMRKGRMEGQNDISEMESYQWCQSVPIEITGHHMYTSAKALPK